MTDAGDVTIPGASSENCPSCGAPIAAGQRYCLECGARRGDPRLPFMDAVVFMESVNQPQQPQATATTSSRPDKRPLLSANASLVAGVATLVLAIGVGVLIGRSGDSGAATAANTTPQIIKVGGGEAETTETGGGGSGGEASGGGKKKGSSATSKQAEKKGQTGSSGQTKASEEVLKPAGDVKLADPEQKVGDKCEKGTAGCGDSGTFDGSFFGE